MPSAIILAAGLGTRLAPLTNELPKPLVWLGDRPMIAHVVERLAKAGVGPIAVNTHHLAGSFDALEVLGLTLVHEPAILGTAGGVANARGVLGEGDVVVWNGDLAADVDVAALLFAHGDAFATLAVAARAIGEGTLGLDARGDVVRLRGERFGVEARGADFIGLQILGARARAALPPTGCLVGDVLLPALRRGDRLATYLHGGPWEDVGSLGAYLGANLRWLAARGAAAHLGPGAIVDPGVALHGVVVGAGAHVTGAGTLRDVVIWPGATASAPLARAIVTPRACVAVS